MPIEITLDLLAPGFRTAWLSVPVHPSLPEMGWARVQVKETSKRIWDELWAELQRAERVRGEAVKEKRSPQVIAEARGAERAAGTAILKACVVGHDSTDFIVKVPSTEPEHPSYAPLLSALLKAGLHEEAAVAALHNGTAETPFCVDDKGVITEATLELYDRVGADRQFVVSLLAGVYRFHCGEVLTAADHWRGNGVKEERIPPPFYRAPKPAKMESA